METENGTPAADVVHPLQTAAFLVNSTINNQVNVNFTASQPDIPMTNLYYQCRAERTSSFRNNATELGGFASFGLEVGGGGKNTELVPSNSKTSSQRNAISGRESARGPLKLTKTFA